MSTPSNIMTIEAYVAAIYSNVPKGYDLVCGSCPDANEDTGEGCGDCEACNQVDEFSAYNCELCGDGPGAREPAAIIKPGEPFEEIYYAVCHDCICFIANGDVPEHAVDPDKATDEELEALGLPFTPTA
jgi:hypothetical protein